MTRLVAGIDCMRPHPDEAPKRGERSAEEVSALDDNRALRRLLAAATRIADCHLSIGDTFRAQGVLRRLLDLGSAAHFGLSLDYRAGVAEREAADFERLSAIHRASLVDREAQMARGEDPTPTTPSERTR